MGDYLLAHALDQLAQANWMFATVNQDEDADPLDPPQPVPRPGVASLPEDAGVVRHAIPAAPRLAAVQLAAFFSWPSRRDGGRAMICGTVWIRRGSLVNGPEQQWSSWRSREILIRADGDSAPIPLEIRGVFGAQLDAHIMQRTATTQKAGYGSTMWGRSRQRIVLPSDFNSLRLFRHGGKATFTGVGGWKVRRLAEEEVELVTGEMSGEGPWVLRVADGVKKWLRITWNKGQYAGVLTHFGPAFGAGKELSAPNHTHETISVTGPGFVLLNAQHWSLTTD
ncbi:hypothetical protein [Streptomyces venezuelae]|uniref:hypothetical protein n=1 Tax=Streptomyces venezuelae TaxID=54571 RepID=UPI0016862D7F|nr:hypothetical protein [Streptomyces venezuelae]